MKVAFCKIPCPFLFARGWTTHVCFRCVTDNPLLQNSSAISSDAFFGRESSRTQDNDALAADLLSGLDVGVSAAVALLQPYL